MPIKLLLGKPGLDVHDRGIRMIAQCCRDAGMEVVYLGTGVMSVAECIAAAMEEDVDVIGLSVLTGQPQKICADALRELAKHGASEVPLVVGGVIRAEAVPELEAMGVARVFTAGTPMERIIASIERLAGEKEAADDNG